MLHDAAVWYQKAFLQICKYFLVVIFKSCGYKTTIFVEYFLENSQNNDDKST